MSDKINISIYFNKGTFVIPDYQRGYKWSVKDKEMSSLDFFMDSLIEAYNTNVNEYFIEAVTVVEEANTIILVDGQQRTTSLFLLFAVLEKFDFIKNKLIYDVRVDSHIWLSNLINNNLDVCLDENLNDDQDIHYFKKAIKEIILKLEKINKDDFFNFINEKVFLLFNPIPKEKAITTFISLNGLKAIMKDEELIKSDLLIKSSRQENIPYTNEIHKVSSEWRINEDRGRLARNWDKWLYWWNTEKVKKYFNVGDNHPLYYLLVTYWKINLDDSNNVKDFSFDKFKNQFINNAKEAKFHFEGLRKLQKTFEDLYNDTYSHNFLGIILKTSNSREAALHYFLNSKSDKKISLEEYAKWSLVGTTHLEIINNERDNDNSILIRLKKATDSISLISEKYVYSKMDGEDFNDRRKEFAFRFLLLLNLLEDNKLKRKFDYSIWDNRSLEHIYPKSKANNLNFDNDAYKEASIHSIGNLVLLYGRDNSSFGAKDYQDKKNTYFNTSEDFKSRNLLHTISVFANSKWQEIEIVQNREKTITQLNHYYGIN
ncbi:DUF262 domain-containing protein [Empedobacter falsenii]|uniref:DUF262 domain-containing protein n=1 Tax=Empedobacter falsenii TaxID=343874 RepID=A0A7H9DS15_9FLAO|nr:DUF262 domain-containing HNH endonuclease family protein [Empedobacter falsenii]QLL57805.1 DUF262 domain-containing protein [Empedobacter falsenii]